MVDPIVFRPSRSPAKRWLMLSFVAFLGLNFTGIAGVLPLLLVDLELVDEPTSHVLGIALATLVGTGCLAFLVRAWRGSRGAGIRVTADSIERTLRAGAEALPFAEIDSLQVQRDAGRGVSRVRIRSRRRTLDLRQGDWPVAEIARALEEHALPVLAARARAALDAGEAVTGQEETGVLSLVVGLGFLGGAAALFIVAAESRGHVHGLIGLAMAGAILVKRWIASVGGGVVLTSSGVRRPGEPATEEVPFGMLHPWKRLAWGLSVEAREGPRAGQQFRLSLGARNEPVVARLLEELHERRD